MSDLLNIDPREAFEDPEYFFTEEEQKALAISQQEIADEEAYLDNQRAGCPSVTRSEFIPIARHMLRNNLV